MEDIKLSYEEKEKFHKAFRQHEFRTLFDEYFDEISDERYRKEKEDYLLSLYFKGELKKDQILIKPTEAFCVKTKVLYANHTNQCLFLNICSHEGIHSISLQNTSRGEVNIPYSLSQIRPDKHGDNLCCLTIDCCINPTTVDVARRYNEILNFLLEDVCINIEKNVMKDKERICRDFKILRNMKCKGEKPFFLCINKNVIKSNIVVEEEKKLEKMKKEFQERNATTTPNEVEKMLKKSKIETEIKTNQQEEVISLSDRELEAQAEVQTGRETERRKKYVVYHQGSLNTSSFFKIKKFEHISLNLPNKIKVLICTDNYVRKSDIHINIQEKKLEVKFSNPEEEDVDIDLPYPCNAKDYSCILKKDKKRIEIYLNLCEQFVRDYAKSMHEKYFPSKGVDHNNNSLDYIDDIVSSYEQRKEVAQVEAAQEEAAQEEAAQEEAAQEEAAQEEAAQEEAAREETAEGIRETPDYKKSCEETSKSDRSSRDKEGDEKQLTSSLEPCESTTKEKLVENNSEKKLDNSLLLNDGNHFLNFNVNKKLNLDNIDNAKSAKRCEEDPPDFTLNRSSYVLRNEKNNFNENLKIEVINEDSKLCKDEDYDKSLPHSRVGTYENEESKINKIHNDKEKREKSKGVHYINESDFLKDINMYENADRGLIFSSMLWTAYI
ncbi:PIH1 domain-containing protein, putative [Plasmodium ovale wallikeri]|uniref:PIH1 domain-containing protein, putative n=1 Tax=Plasmodium ovale wallikeri TaxID=864142 RepID=A0A1A8YRS6_PLAOA|nr:PIH1 domain-containing protein, putative [Plasmodium ovale wallikeri]